MCLCVYLCECLYVYVSANPVQPLTEQLEELPEPQTIPAGQAWHAVDPTVEYSPVAQATGDAVGSGHSDPAGQIVHSMFPVDVA